MSAKLFYTVLKPVTIHQIQRELGMACRKSAQQNQLKTLSTEPETCSGLHLLIKYPNSHAAKLEAASAKLLPLSLPHSQATASEFHFS